MDRMASTHFTRSSKIESIHIPDVVPKRSRDEQSLVRDVLEKLTGLKFTLAEAEHIANQLEDPVAARKASADSISNAKRKLNELESSSSLSPPSQIASPVGATGTAGNEAQSARVSPTSSDSSSDKHQPRPAASMAHFQTFGPDPSTFDDPTIYHIREVTDDMGDVEKKEIYGVSSFPKSDLSHLVAGKLPDKDFSSAKPTNQVNANTFAAYIEPYVRPLTEEDMAWLKERVCEPVSFHCFKPCNDIVLGRSRRTLHHTTSRQALLQGHLGGRRRPNLRRRQPAGRAPSSEPSSRQPRGYG